MALSTTAPIVSGSDEVGSEQEYQKVVVDRERTDLAAPDEPEPTTEHVHKTTFKLLIIALFIGWVLAAIFIVLYVIEVNNETTSKSNCNEANQSTSSTTTLSPTTTPAPTSSSSSSIPKNLIVLVSDGMGQSYNSAYRQYKNVTRTVLDEYLKGRFSTTPSNPNGVADSAAGATVFSTGFNTLNTYVGVDKFGNPKGTIIEAAKRKGKGTGIIATKAISDATPASFSSHSLYRKFYNLIAKQQVMRQIDGKPMLDLLFGGGRKHFESWGFWNNATMHEQYGWSKVSNDSVEFLENLETTDIDDLPFMFLPAEGSFPYYLDRINGYVKDTDSGPYPDLIQMSKKAINLLSTKYEDEGFFLLIESSEIDLCGHDNDIVCLLWEVQQFMDLTEFVMDWAKEDEDTLVVIVSDHETGGMTLGRDGSFLKSDITNNWERSRTVRNDDISGSWGSYAYDYSIEEPLELSSTIKNMAFKKWYPTAVSGAKHTASWFADQLNNGGINSFSELLSTIESDYLGSVDPVLTDKEIAFMNATYNRDANAQKFHVANLMSTRTLTGWTTRQHTGLDCSVYAFGPSEDEFRGQWTNYEIGQILSRVFDVESEQLIETQMLEKLFLNETLQICDAGQKPNDEDIYIEWNKTIEYPPGNLLHGSNMKCVDEWV